MPRARGRTAARWLLWVVFLGAMLLVVTRFASLEQLARAFAQASIPFVVAAIALHVGYFLVYALIYREGFAVVGVRAPYGHVLPLYFASTVANAIAPVGGAAGAAVFVADARLRGQSAARAAVGMLVVLLADLATLFPFIAWGLLVLGRRGAIAGWIWLGAGAYTAFVLLLVGGILLSRRAAWREARVLGFVERRVNRLWDRIRHRPLLRPGWAEDTAEHLSAAAAAVSGAKGKVAVLTLLGLLLHAVNLGDLWALFGAFHQPVTPGPLVAGFSMGIVFFIVGIVPQGVAVVEGVMSLVFTSLGFSPARVAATVVAFRGLNFFLPILVGLFFFRRISRLASSAPPEPARET